MRERVTDDIHHCWFCRKKLENTSKRYEEECYFWCNQDCRDQCEFYNYVPEKVSWDDEKEAPPIPVIMEEEIPGQEAYLESLEKEVRKGRRQYKCGKCGELGHNARTCEKKEG